MFQEIILLTAQIYDFYISFFNDDNKMTILVLVDSDTNSTLVGVLASF